MGSLRIGSLGRGGGGQSTGLEEMQISQEDVYISNKFPTMSYVLVKSHNFPPNGQISREVDPRFPTFSHCASRALYLHVPTHADFFTEMHFYL